MPVELLPRWTLTPNWSSPVLERLDWLSAVLQSPTGSEQRFPLRLTPRRSFEATFTVAFEDRAWFDLAVGSVGASPWYIPVWHDRAVLASEVTSGSSVIPVNLEGDREFQSGGFAMLIADRDTSAVVEIEDANDPGGLRLVSPLVATWGAGTRVYPAIKARIEQQPEMTRRGSAALEGTLRFQADQPNPWTPSISLPTYGNYHVLNVGPNEQENLTHAYMRLLVEMDNSVGKKRTYDTANIGFTLQKHSWMAVGRSEHKALRALLYAMAGRVRPIWLPTFAEDFRLTESALAADTEIVVRKNGYTGFGGPRIGREHIAILLRDGTSIYRRITGSTINGNTEVLTLNAALGADISPATVLRVCFMSLHRLDQDGVEFQHYTDSDGASTVVAMFKSTPESRDGSDYAPQPFLNTVQNSNPCGQCTWAFNLISETMIEPQPTVGFAFVTNFGDDLIGVSGGKYAVLYQIQNSAQFTKMRAVSEADSVGAQTAISGYLSLTALSPFNAFGVRLSDDSFVAVSSERFSTGFGISAMTSHRTFTADGTLVGSVFRVGDGTVSDGSVAYGVARGNPNGSLQTYYVAQSIGPNGLSELRIRRYDSEHTLLDETGALWETYGSYDRIYRNALCRIVDTLVLAHSTFYTTGREQRLTLSFYDLDLNRTADKVEVNDLAGMPNTGYDDLVGLLAMPDGRLGVVWYYSSLGPGDVGGTMQLRVRFFNANGTPDGASQLLKEVVDITGFNGNASHFFRSAEVSAGGAIVTMGDRYTYSDETFTYTTEFVVIAFAFNGSTWQEVTSKALFDSENAPVSGRWYWDMIVRRMPNNEWIAAGYRNNGDFKAVRLTLTECQ